MLHGKTSSTTHYSLLIMGATEGSDPMTYETILYESAEGVATITLNRPQQLNAVNRQLAQEWGMALAEADRDERVRAVLITGAGRGFCVGQDLSTLKEGMTGGQILREMYNPILLALRRLPKPVVAAVNGAAVGAGMNLALACDLRLAAENASFGQVFARIGALPDSGAFFFLPRMVGLARAAELFFKTVFVTVAAGFFVIAERAMPVRRIIFVFIGRGITLPRRIIFLPLEFVSVFRVYRVIVAVPVSHRAAALRIQ